MQQGSTDNRSAYGDCNVEHGGIITWNLADGSGFEFHYTQDFGSLLQGRFYIGMTDPTLDEEALILGRYALFGRDVNGNIGELFLWLVCDEASGSLPEPTVVEELT